jgi:hypothetical protein
LRGWIANPGDSIWITSITIFEVTFGLAMMAHGQKHLTLQRSFEALRSKLEGRVFLFDESAAEKTANLMADRQRRGTPRDLRDTMIAGIVLAHQGTLATRNPGHFSDISAEVLNPWND